MAEPRLVYDPDVGGMVTIWINDDEWDGINGYDEEDCEGFFDEEED